MKNKELDLETDLLLYTEDMGFIKKSVLNDMQDPGSYLESMEKDEIEWKNLSAVEFFQGYTEDDNIYDSL